MTERPLEYCEYFIEYYFKLIINTLTILTQSSLTTTFDKAIH